MDIIESLRWRYATKKFDTSEIISTIKIERVCTAFNLTATSYGLQPIKLLVVKNKELQLKMQSAAMNQIQVSTASHVLIFCIEKNIDQQFINNHFSNIKSLRPNNNSEGVDAYHKILAGRFEKKSDKEKKLWATKQAYIALGNILTICAIEKIDSCPMEGFIPSKIDELLKLDKKNLSSVLLLPLGIRDKNDKGANDSKVRRPLTDIVEYIF